MKLSQCNAGQIVQVAKQIEAYSQRIGHIVGLSANGFGEVTVKVLLACDKEPINIHYGNIELIEDKPTPSFNEWFLSLEEGRRNILRDDKFMLAEAAYNAGIVIMREGFKIL